MTRKSKQAINLGRSLIKNRKSHSSSGFRHERSGLHSRDLGSDVEHNAEPNRPNLQSVTEESALQEFLSTAQLAGTEFQAEKLNVQFIDPNSNAGLPTKAERLEIERKQQLHCTSLAIPRRPPWDVTTTADQLKINEESYFLNWRRALAELQEKESLILTPYEKNLEFWRQLWRVLERSDVIVQIVDARNPLLFRCADLECYVDELSTTSLSKSNLILVNKADLLTPNQRKQWHKYFLSIDRDVVFYSALLNSDDNDLNLKELDEAVRGTVVADETGDGVASQDGLGKLLDRNELIELFKTFHMGPTFKPEVVTVGLVGYPNVGKSSTINSLMQAKKVSVSATPGKTKHFQTLFLDKELLLCDCPGLVMPQFVATRADMILNGILPVDQMRDHVPPITLLCQLIPRHVLESRYGILLPKPSDGEDADRPPTAPELLNAYAYNRGFMTANGQPDNARAARYLLKDYINGKLLFCYAPPNVTQEEFHVFPMNLKCINRNRILPPSQVRATRVMRVTGDDVDASFFKLAANRAYTKGQVLVAAGIETQHTSGSGNEKPWKKINKHANKNKREKLRRIYAHLDQH